MTGISAGVKGLHHPFGFRGMVFTPELPGVGLGVGETGIPAGVNGLHHPFGFTGMVFTPDDGRAGVGLTVGKTGTTAGVSGLHQPGLFVGLGRLLYGCQKPPSLRGMLISVTQSLEPPG